MKKKLLLIALFCYLFANAQCVNTPASSSSSLLTYTYVGCSFQSYGCAPIDPTLWFSGSGMSVTVTFANPQDYPTFRVWGMNTDDVASVEVNSISYPLNSSSAYYSPKVVCGLSPGDEGVQFSGGNFAGSNTPAQGNFSYSDIQLNVTNVTSIKIIGISGAGWGFASTLINCPSLNINQFEFENNVLLYPNPTNNYLNLKLESNIQNASLKIISITGQTIFDKQNISGTDFNFDVSNLNSGLYIIQISDENKTYHSKFIKD